MYLYNVTHEKHLMMNIQFKKFFLFSLPASLLAGGMLSCSSGATSLTKSGLDPANFESTYENAPTKLYVLSNDNGAEACITNFGGRVVSLMIPDRDGKLRNVVLGMDSVASYFPENNLSDLGSSVGRYANRIKDGRFVLDGDTAVLPQNNFGHCLHGGGEMGTKGWQYRVYNATQPNDSTLVLTIDSPDGDNGFPGAVKAQVTYTLRGDNSLDIAYEANTDKPTVINMTNHNYFNLDGDPDKKITDHELFVDADSFTPIDSTYMTTGEFRKVEGSPFDFRNSKPVGKDIAANDDQIKFGNGYDHNFVLNTGGDISRPAATLYSADSGILLTVYTTEPGVQVYSGNFLDGSLSGGGKVFGQRAGICLETQHYPDSPNKPEWPSSRLYPGEKYTSHTIYKFDTQ